MGLDCIPHVYPCVHEGTAIMVDKDDRSMVDCAATIAAEQCPWKHAAERRGTPVYGMLGVPCWYRGKAGNWMLEELALAGYTLPHHLDEGFYGNVPQEAPGPHLSPDYCTELAAWMEDHAEAYAKLHMRDEDWGRDAIDSYRYAAWWLRFVAAHAEGSDVWW